MVKRWWTPSSKSPARLGEWFYLMDGGPSTNDLVASCVLGPLDPIGMSPTLLSEDIEAFTGACIACERWDPKGVAGPYDLEVNPQTLKGNPIDRRVLRYKTMERPIGSPTLVAKRSLLEAMGPDVPDRWLIGRVLVRGGGEIDELCTIIDPESLWKRLRPVFTQGWFKYIGSATYEACRECGRLLDRPGGQAWYLHAQEAAGEKASADVAMLLVPRSAVERAELRDRKRWPRLDTRDIPVRDAIVDPYSSPLPVWWEEFDHHQRSCGVSPPFPKIPIEPDEPVGSWLEAQIEERGYEACVLLDGEDLAERCVVYARLWACWDAKVARRIEGLNDARLADAIRVKLKDRSRKDWLPGS
ncbi:MAG: hypothetical protein EA423_02245 [Phycisphaerales bacterium]|nr:MAG: hypothetical protein EA423_02245 [Phycisphaerales bacterium]